MVLIADDNANIRLLVSATLASQQYAVIEAANGEEAWRLIREHRPAVVILDWEMPVYTGLELTVIIKGDSQLRETMVIMLTVALPEPTGRRVRERDADVYLVKPFSPQELLTAVEQALGIR
jgi:two-component system phosphate regulon response regulator PhoB